MRKRASFRTACLLLGLFCALATWAAISFDTFASSTAQDSVQTVTWSHTVAAGSDRVMITGCAARESPDNGFSSAAFNSSESYTEITAASISNSSRVARMARLVNPTATTASNSWTWTGTDTDTSRCVSWSLTGVDQATPIDQTFETAPAGAGNACQASMTVTADAWVLYLLEIGSACNSCNITHDSGQTNDLTAVNQGASNPLAVAAAHKGPVSGAQTIGTTWTGSNNYACVAISLKPAAGGTIRMRRAPIVFGGS